MAKHRVRVGLHARNDVHFTEPDYALVRTARIETLKMMSFTDPGVYERLRRENATTNGGIEFIVRLYDDRIGRDSRPSPAAFVDKMVPVIKALKSYVSKFEIHNEPNHVDGIEGWGASDENARMFRDWYLQVLAGLKAACPWARFGFPGLALSHPHRDLVWLDICQEAILASDWLGCHCYWQYGNMLKDDWGLRFKLYHERFPRLPIEITEFGNSTPNLPREKVAEQYPEYYQAINHYPYLGSASAFIASSPDPTWGLFVWLREGGDMLPVAHAVREMPRTAQEVAPEPEPGPKPGPKSPPEPSPTTGRKFFQTGKTVRGAFLKFHEQYGLDICGYPITDEIREGGVPAQYFQRLALEEHQPGKVRLKLVGTEAWISREKIARLEAQLQEFRNRSGAKIVKPPLEGLVDQLPVHPSKAYPVRPLSDINRIVIHHTATSPTVTAQSLANYMVNTMDKPAIAYHFFIAADGRIYQTSDLQTVTDHAHDRNQDSVGICFAGNFTSDVPPVAQLEAGARLCAWLLDQLHLTSDVIVGLGEFAETQSPGLQWLGGQRWKDKLLASVGAILQARDHDEAPSVAELQPELRTRRDRAAAGQSALSTVYDSSPARAPASAPAPGLAAISAPLIQDLTRKLGTHQTKRYNTRAPSSINTIVIHHSAAPPQVGPQQIAAYHVNRLDWPGIGYHYLVGRDGMIYQTNTLETMSNHVGGANSRSLGVCFLGNFNAEVPPPTQLRAGAHLVAWLMQELKVGLDKVRGHKEFMSTACPGIQWLEDQNWKHVLHQGIAQIQKTGRPLPSDFPGAKSIHHYMLFWARDGHWARQDWLNAQDYIGAFRPAAGFSANEAVQAEYVTIVGGSLGVPNKVEAWLVEQGCKVDRIAGQDEADTKRILEELVESGKRFWHLAAG
jgi:N-acetyl-anhydromuramyl-L-alanine amidase AmpD